MSRILLAKNGTSDWTVVTPDHMADVEKTAVREWIEHFAKITDVTLPVVPESSFAGGNGIFIGACGADADFDLPALGNEGYVYRVSPGRVQIRGGKPVGTLYGVYSFLEDVLGCRWFTETLSVIPEAAELAVEECEKSFVPPMHYRAASFADAQESVYCARNKLNARSWIPAEYGGAMDFGIGFVHTLPQLIPDALFDEHPEYFPLIGGKRVVGQWQQRCLTNPDVLAITVEKVREAFRTHPEYKVCSVSQNDGYADETGCTCDACRAVNDAEGSLMGTQLRFVNAVADAIREEFPDRYIETLAYRFTRHVPKLTRPRNNVIIRLCSIECCFSHAIDTCQHSNPAFIRDMEDWAGIADHIYIWDYVTNFAHYLAPHPNLHVLGPNMKFFADHHTVGMFPEGAPDGRGAEMSELKAWILAKLEWDPDYPVDKGVEEFIRAYCGRGWKVIWDYVKELNDRAERIGSHRGCYAEPDREFFPLDFVERAEAAFAQAKEQAEDEETLTRIRRWEMSIRYLRLYLYGDTIPADERRDTMEAFLADVSRLGISKLHEGGTSETGRERMLNRMGLN